MEHGISYSMEKENYTLCSYFTLFSFSSYLMIFFQYLYIGYSSPEEQNQKDMCVFIIYICISNWLLIMEAEKSQDLKGKLAQWRHGKTDCIVLVWMQRPENQENQ
jgi:hypothetical protein